MNAREGLIVALPERGEPLWMRVVEGEVVQSGTGAKWLAACGLTALPEDATVLLVPPAALVTLTWVEHPDLAPRQGRAAARLAALADSIVPADQLFAVADDNEDPARPHIVAVASRSDMQHWLLWAQHHGLDPDIIVPAPLLLPEPAEGVHRGVIAGEQVLRGPIMAMAGDVALPALAEQAVLDVPAAQVNALAIAALERPPIDLRQGDFAKRVRRSVDGRVLARIMLWSGLILIVSLLIALTGIARQHVAAGNLDAESLAMARQVAPGAADLDQAEADMERPLAARGAGAYAFTAPVAGVLSAMQDAPGVSLTTLSRDASGTIGATLSAAKTDEINRLLIALQAMGFTVTAAPSQSPSGQIVADITVRP